MNESENTYPAGLTIDYPAKADRLSTFFRLLWIIPIFIVLGTLIGGHGRADTLNGYAFIYTGPGFLFLPTLLMIVFRQKYPRWWFGWNLALAGFVTRVSSYLLLLRHEYPSTDAEQAVHINITYPDVEKDLQRGMPLVKWLLVLPHVIVLYFLYLLVLIVTVIAWLSIIFTGEYPRSFFDFVVGVMRWSLRVFCYSILLTTDEYPPFSLT